MKPRVFTNIILMWDHLTYLTWLSWLLSYKLKPKNGGKSDIDNVKWPAEGEFTRTTSPDTKAFS